jgi:hypothetical protein
MVPDAAHVKDGGRGNPPGVAYLYLADSRETAVAEVRPWVKADVSLASFRVGRLLNLLDLTLFPPSRDPYESVSTGTPSPEETEQAVWSAINWAFAEPVNPYEPQLEYAPTQRLARAFLEAGFDGLMKRYGMR